MLHRQKRALEICRENPIPVGFRHLNDAAELGNAHVVVKHVDAAIGGRARLNHCFGISGVTDVGAVCHRLAAIALDDVGDLFGGPLVCSLTADRAAQVVDDDLGALLGQLERLAPADAVPRPGDDGHLAVEQTHPLDPPVSAFVPTFVGPD